MASPLDTLLASIPIVGPADFTTLVQLVETQRQQIATLQTDQAALLAALTAAGQGACINLRGFNGATPGSQYRVTVDLLAIEGGLVGALTARAFDVTCDFTTTGLNGRATGSLTDGEWHLWAVSNPTTNAVGLTAQKDCTTRAALDLTDSSFAGFTQARRVDVVKRASGNLLRQFRQDNVVTYDQDIGDGTGSENDCNVVTNGAGSSSTSWITADCSAFVPVTARRALLQHRTGSVFNTAHRIYTRPKGSPKSVGTLMLSYTAIVTDGGGGTPTEVQYDRGWQDLDANQDYEYRCNVGQTLGPYFAWVLGYEDPVT